MGTILVGSILVVAVVFIVRGMIRDKKNGKSIQCGGDCRYCGGHCTQKPAQEEKPYNEL